MEKKACKVSAESLDHDECNDQLLVVKVMSRLVFVLACYMPSYLLHLLLLHICYGQGYKWDQPKSAFSVIILLSIYEIVYVLEC